jgi:hypothetical protein
MALHTCDKHLALISVEGDANDKRSSLQHFSDSYNLKYICQAIFIYKKFQILCFQKSFFLEAKDDSSNTNALAYYTLHLFLVRVLKKQSAVS